MSAAFGFQQAVNAILDLRNEALADMAHARTKNGAASDWEYMFGWGQAHACERMLRLLKDRLAGTVFWDQCAGKGDAP